MPTHVTTRINGEKRTHIDITVRKIPMPLYLLLMKFAAEYSMSQNNVIMALLENEFLGRPSLDFLNFMSDELKTAIQGYADAAGLSLKDQIIKDLKEMYL